MANSGWIRLHRKMRNWEWYRDCNTFKLFVHLLLSANHCQQKWQGLLIERGQLVTGRKALSEQTGLSVREVRTSLDKLKTTNELTIKTTSKFSVITISNYDTYQPLGMVDDQQNDQQNDQQATNKRPASDHKQ